MFIVFKLTQVWHYRFVFLLAICTFPSFIVSIFILYFLYFVFNGITAVTVSLWNENTCVVYKTLYTIQWFRCCCCCCFGFSIELMFLIHFEIEFLFFSSFNLFTSTLIQIFIRRRIFFPFIEKKEVMNTSHGHNKLMRNEMKMRMSSLSIRSIWKGCEKYNQRFDNRFKNWRKWNEKIKE